MRVTWIQPEDLIGHELRQAREEGKDVDEVEARWYAAGGAPAPARGASQEPVISELQALALELLDEIARTAKPLVDDEPEELDAILAAAPGVSPLQVGEDVDARIQRAWLGRAAGCLLGKPVESIPREGIRAIAESTRNWPVRGYFSAEGLDPRVSERWPWNRASRPTSRLRRSPPGILSTDTWSVSRRIIRSPPELPAVPLHYSVRSRRACRG